MRDPYAYGGLGQLTSPPVSAIEMIELFRDSTPDQWIAPLGTIDALISPHPDDPHVGAAGDGFTEPTMANLRRAFRSWWDRCNRDHGNVAILYLCGHGIEADEQYFLASDFGADELSPWQNAVAVDSTIKGLWHNQAATQCVFVDACREVVPAAKEALRIDAPALAHYSRDRTTHVAHPLELKAVAPTERAFASLNSVAYFTKALKLALAGGAAEEDAAGEWVVTTSSIAHHFYDIFAEVAPHRSESPSPRPGRPTVLYRPPTPPSVTVEVRCNPAEALDEAHLSCRPDGTSDAVFTREPPEGTAWELKVPAGYYRVMATFDQGSRYRDDDQPLLASPPRRGRELTVR